MGAARQPPGRGDEALRRLWTEPETTLQGRYTRVEDVEALPKPLEDPYPIWIANSVRGPNDSERVLAALRRVARVADGWQTAVPEAAFEAWTAWGSPEEVADRLEADVAAMGNVLPRFESRLAPPRPPVS